VKLARSRDVARSAVGSDGAAFGGGSREIEGEAGGFRSTLEESVPVFPCASHVFFPAPLFSCSRLTK